MVMPYPKIDLPESQALDLEEFKKMDYYAVEHYALPIELMMENAGLQLAKLVVHTLQSERGKVLIGVGNGNNGGGGLVAARRLAAWGYEVFLDLFTEIKNDLPLRQLERAQKFGAVSKAIAQPDIWVDAYLGFSQRLPLRPKFLERIQRANQCHCPRIALDLPTGFLGDSALPHFQAHQVLSLAAAKKILYRLDPSVGLYVADLGIPKVVYQKFDIEIPPFNLSSILRIR